MSRPYVVSLASLSRQEGAFTAIKRTLEAPEGMAVEMTGVKAGSSIAVDLTLTSVSEGVLVVGTVEADVEGQCARCLTDLSEHTSTAISELVFYPERREALAAEGDEDVADAPVVDNDEIDLEPIIRDAVVLALPFTPLCNVDCAGLCPDCGERLDDLPADHTHGPAYDPRFDALAELEEKLKERQ